MAGITVVVGTNVGVSVLSAPPLTGLHAGVGATASVLSAPPLSLSLRMGISLPGAVAPLPSPPGRLPLRMSRPTGLVFTVAGGTRGN